MAEFAADVASAYAEELRWEPRFNLAPTQNVLAIRELAGQRQWCQLRWGLIPSWAKEPKIGSSLINARAETVAEKPSFRAAFKRRRCLIPADGFYEWQKTAGPGNKVPHFFTVGQASLFTFAGLWESWRGDDGTTLETCTIITTTPNELLQPLHDRMPVILNRSDYVRWLDPASDPGTLGDLLVPYPASEMTCRAVGKFVNSAAHEGPECLE